MADTLPLHATAPATGGKSAGSTCTGHIGRAKSPSHCDRPRQRWPDPEAMIQVFFRILSSSLHAGAFGIAVFLRWHYHVPSWHTYMAITWCWLVDSMELCALTIPPFGTFRRTPRLPSAYLVVMEFVSISFTAYSLVHLLMPHASPERVNINCNPATCVTPAERLQVDAYACQISALMIHVGFFVTALTHVLKKTVPEWMERWDI